RQRDASSNPQRRHKRSVPRRIPRRGQIRRHFASSKGVPRMTRDDFNSWLDHHYAVFPGFNKWLLSMPQVDRSATLRAWSNILETIPLAIAKEASETLYTAEAIPVYE